MANRLPLLSVITLSLLILSLINPNFANAQACYGNITYTQWRCIDGSGTNANGDPCRRCEVVGINYATCTLSNNQCTGNGTNASCVDNYNSCLGTTTLPTCTLSNVIDNMGCTYIAPTATPIPQATATPVPTNTPVPGGCGTSCTNSSQCQSNLSCFNNICWGSSCGGNPTNTPIPQATATPTPPAEPSTPPAITPAIPPNFPDTNNDQQTNLFDYNFTVSNHSSLGHSRYLQLLNAYNKNTAPITSVIYSENFESYFLPDNQPISLPNVNPAPQPPTTASWVKSDLYTTATEIQPLVHSFTANPNFPRTPTGDKFMSLKKSQVATPPTGYNPYLVTPWIETGSNLNGRIFRVDFNVKNHLDANYTLTGLSLQRYPTQNSDGTYNWDNTLNTLNNQTITASWSSISQVITIPDNPNSTTSKLRLVIKPRLSDSYPLYYDNLTITQCASAQNCVTPAEPFPTDAPSPTASQFVSTVFITSTTHTGNLGGLTGADTICQTRAAAAGLSGTYKAWLSSATEDAKDRIPDARYELVNDTVVATSKVDLTDGSIQAAINVNELGQTLTGAIGVLTGTKQDGTKVANFNYCPNSNNNAWTRGDGVAAAGYGVNTDMTHWSDYSINMCNGTNLRLYCFQTATANPTPPAP